MKKITKSTFLRSELKIPVGVFHSSKGVTFECRLCGYVWDDWDTLDDRIDCPHCGGDRTGLRQ